MSFAPRARVDERSCPHAALRGFGLPLDRDVVIGEANEGECPPGSHHLVAEVEPRGFAYRDHPAVLVRVGLDAPDALAFDQASHVLGRPVSARVAKTVRATARLCVLRGVDPVDAYLSLVDPKRVPVDDLRIAADVGRTPGSRRWQRRRLGTDRERANRAYFRTVSFLVPRRDALRCRDRRCEQ